MSDETQEPEESNPIIEVSVDDWHAIHLASQFSAGLAASSPMDETISWLEQKTSQKIESAVPLDTGLWIGRKGVLFRCGTTIALVFEATRPNEVIMNTWSHVYDNTWTLPSARLLEGHQVHSFYLDMWLGMRESALEALSENINALEENDQQPSSLILTGHSMGGGISTLAVVDVVEHLRKNYGSESENPRTWALDDKLGKLFRHLTFAEYAASGRNYNTRLNQFYARHRLPAWDFVHPQDFSSRLHLPFFRAWRGQRYILPQESVCSFAGEYGGGKHNMAGYLKSMKWLKDNPRKLQASYDYVEI